MHHINQTNNLILKQITMSAIINVSLDVTKLPKEKFVKGKKGTYINLTMYLQDEADQFGNNASLTVAQTQEEREAKDNRLYLGNGKIAWTDGNISAAERQDSSKSSAPEVSDEDTSDLPF